MLAIVHVENTKQIPSIPMWAVALGKNDTEADAVDNFVHHFGREPERGWRYNNCVYWEATK
jgi:hypothetical protein